MWMKRKPREWGGSLISGAGPPLAQPAKSAISAKTEPIRCFILLPLGRELPRDKSIPKPPKPAHGRLGAGRPRGDRGERALPSQGVSGARLPPAAAGTAARQERARSAREPPGK